jgi:hypothetical protein
MPDDKDSSAWDPDGARRLIRDLPSPPEYDVEPEYAQGFANAHEYAQELAGALGEAIAEIDRLRAASDGGHRRLERMNDSERSAWRVLLGLGARPTELAGKSTLDLRPIRATSEKKLRLLVQACLGVAGRSGCNRRHVDRAGVPVYVVTDDLDPPKRP